MEASIVGSDHACAHRVFRQARQPPNLTRQGSARPGAMKVRNGPVRMFPPGYLLDNASRSTGKAAMMDHQAYANVWLIN
jgi:hypothetical protein